jgi:hypothetical protein
MNNKERKQWESLVDSANQKHKKLWESPDEYLIILANAYIMKLERELQNIKGHKRIAKVLMPKETT